MGEKVAAGMAEDMGEGMQCIDHPYRRNPSGICAFCLQEKLGKLVSSSKSADPFFSTPPPTSSSSSPPSFASSDLPSFSSSASSTRISFLSAKYRRHKLKGPAPASTQSTAAAPLRKVASAAADLNNELLILNRSKSVAPRHCTGKDLPYASGGPRKNSLWSFFSLTYYSSSALIPYFSNKRRSTSSTSSSSAIAGNGGADLSKTVKDDEKTPRREQDFAFVGNDDGSPSGSQASSSFGRKVARSRSVGCGSRSFSGDFLERISNGFGDCTLRRVESHREAKPKASVQHRGRHGDDEAQQFKERVKCGGIFVGLGMVSSSTYWFSTVDACDESCRLPATRRSSVPHGRSKSWGWAFASPLRAFRPGVGGQSTIIAAGGDLPGSSSPIRQC